MVRCKNFLKSERPLFVLVLALCAWGLIQTTTASSSNTPSSSYTSIRALDEFGNSIQLQHAREASRKHGRLVLAAASSNTIVVVSLGTKPMVQAVTLPILSCDNVDGQGGSKGSLSMCCTGVKGDANWLILKVQQQAAKIWERYNHGVPSSGSIAHYVSRLLGSFNGEDLDREWQASVKRDQEEEESWARPLGVQTMILSTTGSPNILMIEPSGRVFSTKVGDDLWFSSMGKNSDVVMEHYNRLKLDDEKSLDASQLQKVLVDLVLDIEGNRDGIELLVEVLDHTGIQRSVLQYDKNGKPLATTRWS